MSFQFVGQSTFTALGCAKRAVFFSIFRKVIIVVPLTIILPMLGLGVEGVFIAEPVSNAIGGLASFTTMYFTLYKNCRNSILKTMIAKVPSLLYRERWLFKILERRIIYGYI